MLKLRTAGQCLQSLHERGASFLLLALLAGDLAFIALHFLNGLTHLLDMPLLNLERDGGYPEMYQYLKLGAAVIVMLMVTVRRAAPSYAVWVLVFAYLLVDDSMQIHEDVGGYVAARLAFAPSLGLRLQDYGELIVSASAGAALLLLVGLAYRQGTRAFQKSSRDLLLLVAVLAFFGVVVDTAHVALMVDWKVGFLLAVAEDGGEMITASAILWYSVLTLLRSRDADCYLCDWMRLAWARRAV